MSMSITLNRQAMEVERLAAQARVQLPVRAEALASGAGRESVEILMEDAAAAVEQVEVRADRVVVTGSVQCQGIYAQGQEGSVRALTAQAPFEQIFEMEGVRPKMTARARAVVEHVEAAYEVGHMVFSVTLEVQVRVSSLSTAEPVTSITGEPVQQQTEPLTSLKLNAEAGAMCSLKGSVSLPAELDARVPLMYWARPVVQRLTRDLGGVRVSGETAVEALVLSGVKNRPVILIRYRLPFEQLVELPDWLQGEYRAEGETRSLRLTVEAGEGQDSALAIECGVQLSLRVLGKDQAEVLADAYQTGESDLELTGERVEVCVQETAVEAEVTCKNTMTLDEGAAPAGTVLATHVLPVIGDWQAQGDKTRVEGVLESTVVYLAAPGGEMASTRGEIPFEIGLPGALDENAWVEVTSSDAEASALMSDRLEVRCRLTARGEGRVSREVTLITDARQVEAAASRRGVALCYPQEGDSLWSLAKRYRVPTEALQPLSDAQDAPLMVVK